MKIGIDARFYGPSGKGIGRYTQKMIESLEKLDQENEYFIFLRQENFDLYQPRNERFKKVLVSAHWYSWQEQIILPWQLKKYHLDLIHFLHFNVPVFYCGQFMITIHDLTLFNFSTNKNETPLGRFFFFFRKLFFWLVFKSAIYRAEKILTDSDFTKQELIKRFNLSPNKIQTISLGGE